MMNILIKFSDHLQVWGTPASGKMTLARLLEAHIVQQEEGKTNILFFNQWPLDVMKNATSTLL